MGTVSSAKLLQKALKLGAERTVVRNASAPLMLASPYERSFSSDEWIFELKYDGFRLRCAKEQGAPKLYYRRGSNVTAQYPEIASAVAALAGNDLLLDGELVAFDAAGKPDFEALQGAARSPKGKRNALRFIAFDLLGYEGADLRRIPFVQRRELLHALVPDAGALGRAFSVVGDGDALFAEVRKHKLEGMVAKRAASLYEGCRSDAWRKICIRQEQEFFIVGLERDYSALHLADSDLSYAGKVELGIPARALKETEAQWRRLEVKRTPRSRSQIWLRPELRCRVRFKQRTASGRLRDPLLVGFIAGARS